MINKAFSLLFLIILAINITCLGGNDSLITFPTMEELHKILQNTAGYKAFLRNAMTEPANDLSRERQAILDFYQRELQANQDSPVFMYEFFTGQDTMPPSLNNGLVTKKFYYTIISRKTFVRGNRYKLIQADQDFIKKHIAAIKIPSQSLLLEKNLTTSLKTVTTEEMLWSIRTDPRCTYVTYWTAGASSKSFVGPAYMSDLKTPKSVPTELMSWHSFIRYFGRLSQTRYKESDKISMSRGGIQVKQH